MIYCEHASQTVNLYASVIKFLDFDGFVWSGDSLPLVIHSLGELYQCQVELRDQHGGRERDVVWEHGQLKAPFRPTCSYSLSMRLEYYLPTSSTVFKNDFTSIHPMSYRLGLDFSAPGTAAENAAVQVDWGERQFFFRAGQNQDLDLGQSRSIRMITERDFCSVAASDASEIPYGHKNFPVISVLSGG